MKKRKIKIILRNDAKLPVYGTLNSSGADVYCNESVILSAGERKLVHTGIYLDLPSDVEVQVRPRSGLALKLGVTVINAPGTIDSDYQGECCIALINHSKDVVFFEKGERLAQFVFVENVIQADFEIVDDFEKETERGSGGFGHTGTKVMKEK